MALNMTREGPGLAWWHLRPLQLTKAVSQQGRWIIDMTKGLPGVMLMTAAPHGQLLAFQVEQGHTSLDSKVLYDDYNGLVIH